MKLLQGKWPAVSLKSWVLTQGLMLKSGLFLEVIDLMPDRVWQQSESQEKDKDFSFAHKSREVCFKALGRGHGWALYCELGSKDSWTLENVDEV